mgnify:CR=1 FL=1
MTQDILISLSLKGADSSEDVGFDFDLDFEFLSSFLSEKKDFILNALAISESLQQSPVQLDYLKKKDPQLIEDMNLKLKESKAQRKLTDEKLLDTKYRIEQLEVRKFRQKIYRSDVDSNEDNLTSQKETKKKETQDENQLQELLESFNEFERSLENLYREKIELLKYECALDVLFSI